MELSRNDRNNIFPAYDGALAAFAPCFLGIVIPKCCVTYQNSDMKERQNKRRDRIRKGESENLNLAESLLLVVIV
jgi:hypothetical protein